jgi:hypothetical protein
VKTTQETAIAVAELHARLAGVARAIAKLLVKPRYDEAQLAELEVQARSLRRQIEQARGPQIDHEVFGSRLVPGGTTGP